MMLKVFTHFGLPGPPASVLAMMAIIVSFAADGWAQEDAELALLSERATAFLERIEDEAPAAFKGLLANSPLSDTDEIDRVILASKEFPRKYGAFLSAELVGTRKVGEDVVVLTFLYKAERFPLVWRFAFYRPRGEGTQWGLVALRFDSKLLDVGQAVSPTP